MTVKSRENVEKISRDVAPLYCTCEQQSAFLQTVADEVDRLAPVDHQRRRATQPGAKLAVTAAKAQHRHAGLAERVAQRFARRPPAPSTSCRSSSMWKKSSASWPSAVSNTMLMPFTSWPTGIRKPSTNTACGKARRHTVTGRERLDRPVPVGGAMRVPRRKQVPLPPLVPPPVPPPHQKHLARRPAGERQMLARQPHRDGSRLEQAAPRAGQFCGRSPCHKPETPRPGPSCGIPRPLIQARAGLAPAWERGRIHFTDRAVTL